MLNVNPDKYEEPMHAICKMVTETKFTDLPVHVVNQAKRSILDTLAVTIGGSAMDGIKTVVDFVKDKGGKPESAIPFYGGRVPASEAGLAIGPMSRAMDLGDIHEEALHCSEYILPTLLATTGLKRKVSGKEFITSFVVGQEVLVRIGMAYKASSGAGANDRNSGHFIFGCVAAAGKLLNMNWSELEEAQGIASEMTQPHSRAMYSPATLMIRVHHGFICQDAINACLLARIGITGPRSGVLSASKGYLGFARWETNANALLQGLSSTWEMMNITMKRFPSVISTQTAIDAILEQMTEHKFKADDISHIEIQGHFSAGSMERREAMWNPQTVPECQFSIPYTVATAVYDGDVFIDSYTPQKMARKSIHNLMNRITLSQDNTLPLRAARVHTLLKNGRNYSTECIYSKGHPDNPFTEKELIDKFKKCCRYSAYKLTDEVIDKVVHNVLNLEKSNDIAGAIINPLTPQ